jgi:hypothetical protein
MTLATNRPDGWPQATTVGYVHDGLTLYFLCSPRSQKAKNLARDSRVSLTIDHDVLAPSTITGLSMAAEARAVRDPSEIASALKMLRERYPEYATLPMPQPEGIQVFRLVPKVISVLDYTKVFGHIKLVTVRSRDLYAYIRMTGWGQEYPFPGPKPNGRYGLDPLAFAKNRGNEPDAPISDIPLSRAKEG